MKMEAGSLIEYKEFKVLTQEILLKKFREMSKEGTFDEKSTKTLLESRIDETINHLSKSKGFLELTKLMMEVLGKTKKE